MGSKSRRRVTVAAASILAGAVIPIAAGTARADETETQAIDQAKEAAKQGLPAEVSYDGEVVYASPNAVQNNTLANTPTDSTKDLALAIGAGSTAAVVSGNDDFASATGKGGDSTAWITDATDSKATATNGGTAAVVQNLGGSGIVSNDVATANGANSDAMVESDGTGTVSHDVATANGANSQTLIDNWGSGAVTYDAAHTSNGGNGLIENQSGSGTGAVSHDTLSASGSSASGANPNGTNASYAEILNEPGFSSEPVSNDTATATKGGYAAVANDGGSTVPVTHDSAIGNNGAALVGDAGSSSASAVNTGPATFTGVDGSDDNALTAGGSVTYATHSTARAEGAGSMAAVSGTPETYITDSHATDTIGTSTVVITSDTSETNGTVTHLAVEGGETVVMPVHAEMTPLADMHMMPAMPLP
jgi:hypothetical protein